MGVVGPYLSVAILTRFAQSASNSSTSLVAASSRAGELKKNNEATTFLILHSDNYARRITLLWYGASPNGEIGDGSGDTRQTGLTLHRGGHRTWI